MKPVDFETPCGFKIIIWLTDDGELMIKSYFNDTATSFINGAYALSKVGALMLADKIKELYA